ncbi:MAG TPA: histidine kinase [Steroidobacteraceae bacterium]|nr:histidine kinase [Steroidobacteraceae bacterium]
MLKPDEQQGLGVETAANARIDELTELSTLLLKIMEGERSQLAKKLHDELGGMITAAKMDMQWLSAHIGATLDPKGAEKFNSVVQMLDQAMVLKRRVVENLRPSLLEHFGLGVAMRSHFEEHCRQAGIECVASLPEESLDLDAVRQLTLFRVAQYALDGIVGRGGAQNVELVIEPHQEAGVDGYLMIIGDDGGAPDPDATSMLISRHRVALAGGHIDLESRSGSGNQLRVFVPRSAAGSA